MRILVSGSTATVRHLAAKFPNHLGVLLTPDAGNKPVPGIPWAVDNGAFSGFDPAAFRRLLRRVGGSPGCLFVACPDVVGDARATLERFRLWRTELVAQGLPVALVLQDGQESQELPTVDAYFIGGTTRWKLSRAAYDLAVKVKRRGAWLHCGRVNSLKRLRQMQTWGCDSIDGSGYSRYAATYLPRHLFLLEHLDTPQPTLFASCAVQVSGASLDC